MILLFFLTSFWIGMLAGVSLLATLAKFKAPSITRAIALDVGRVTFNWLHVAEVALLVILVIGFGVSGKASASIWVLLAGLAVILVIQIFMLKPLLDKRVSAIISGATLEPSSLHLIYGVLELSLLSLLGILAYMFATHALRLTTIESQHLMTVFQSLFCQTT